MIAALGGHTQCAQFLAVEAKVDVNAEEMVSLCSSALDLVVVIVQEDMQGLFGRPYAYAYGLFESNRTTLTALVSGSLLFCSGETPRLTSPRRMLSRTCCVCWCANARPIREGVTT